VPLWGWHWERSAAGMAVQLQSFIALSRLAQVIYNLSECELTQSPVGGRDQGERLGGAAIEKKTNGV